MPIDQQFLSDLITDPRLASFQKRIAEDVQRRWNSNAPADAFTYTDVFLAGEPYATGVLQVLDGHGLGPNRVPNPAHHAPFQSPDPVVVVALDPEGRITHPCKRQVPIIGRTGLHTETYRGEWPNFAALRDDFPERLARMVIWRSGFPFRGNSGVRHGELVIEWRWLRNTATTVGDEAGHGIVELYQDILARPGFKEFLEKGSKTPSNPEQPIWGRHYVKRDKAAVKP